MENEKYELKKEMNQPFPMRLISIPILPNPGNNGWYNKVCIYDRTRTEENGILKGVRKVYNFKLQHLYMKSDSLLAEEPACELRLLFGILNGKSFAFLAQCPSMLFWTSNLLNTIRQNKL